MAALREKTSASVSARPGGTTPACGWAGPPGAPPEEPKRCRVASMSGTCTHSTLARTATSDIGHLVSRMHGPCAMETTGGHHTPPVATTH